MKNLFFVTAIAVILLCSCSAEPENVITQPAATGSEVRITFDPAGGQFDTRVFFDDTVEAEPWEKDIKTATVYVFDTDGRIVMHKSFSATDLTGLYTSFVLPKSVAGTECTFYAIANYNVSEPFNMENDFLNSNIHFVSNFNRNSFSDIATGSIVAFPMSASKKALVQPQGTPTEVSLVLRRALAKVAVKVSVDEKTFADKYHGGRIRVNTVQVINAASRIAVLVRPEVPNMPMDCSLSQITQAINEGEYCNYCNLFYLGENPPLEESSKVILRIKATFDQDGDYVTPNDQIPFQWDLKIDGSGGGEIKRNGYYRIGAVITGLDALDNVRAFITAAEWETPVTPPTESLH